MALFGAMSFGAFSVYEHYTMSDIEKALLENVEALTSDGEGGSGSGNLWRGYLNATKSCTITETVECSFTLNIPKIGPCKLGFSYTLDHDGSENPCIFTGNNANMCDYYRCRKN